jgi:uncharacterized membrane protein
MDDFYTLLISSVSIVPFFVIFGIGAIIAIVRWRHHPTTSLLALLAFVLFTVRLFASVAITWLSLRRGDMGWDIKTYSLNVGIINLVGTLVSVLGWILLLIALFGRQDKSAALGPDSSALSDPFRKA